MPPVNTMPYINKSTNVRSKNWSINQIRRWVPWLSARFPEYMSRWALRQFTTPPAAQENVQQKLWRSRAEWLPLWHEQSRWLDRPQQGGGVLCWGNGTQTVLLVHGWGGWATQYADWLPALLEKGYRVLAVDMPGHGGNHRHPVSLFHFVAALHLIARTFGPLHAAVGHSLGAAAMTLAAAEGWAVERLVLLAAPEDIEMAPRHFARMLGLPDSIRVRMQDAMAAKYGVAWRELDGRHADRNGSYPALLFHDRQDKEIPYEHGVRLSQRWPGARLVSTEGLGHRRIQRDPEVIRQALTFLTA